MQMEWNGMTALNRFADMTYALLSNWLVQRYYQRR